MKKDKITPSTIHLHEGHSHYGKHKPTGEEWYIIGFNLTGEVCAAGWPASIGKIEDFEFILVGDPLTDEEKTWRRRKFGYNWK